MIKCERGKKQSSKDATEDSDEHSVIWRMFMSWTLRASVFMVKNYSDNWHSMKNTKDLTMKQMFLGGQVDVDSKVHHNTELWTHLMVSPMEFD